MSDWPISFLLDELWLKSHRTIVHKLEEKDLWLHVNDYTTIWNDQKEIGLSIKKDILVDALGEDDFNLINSETVFGKSNHLLKRKLPFSLAFGYELGAGFHDLISGRPEWKNQIVQTTSIFNFGISLFDFFLDNSEIELRNEFKNLFNNNVLNEIQSKVNGGASFYKHCDTIEKNELRILSKVIACFYQKLSNTIKLSENIPHLKKINKLLLRAYHAEIDSQLPDTLSNEVNLKLVSRNKSVLPFRIIMEIAISQVKADKKLEQLTKELSRNIGEIFWIIDDLSDVVYDFQTSQLNSLFCNKKSPLRQMDQGSITRILSSNDLPLLVDLLCSKIQKAQQIIFATGDDAESNFRFKQILLFYVRDWLS